MVEGKYYLDLQWLFHVELINFGNLVLQFKFNDVSVDFFRCDLF